MALKDGVNVRSKEGELWDYFIGPKKKTGSEPFKGRRKKQHHFHKKSFNYLGSHRQLKEFLRGLVYGFKSKDPLWYEHARRLMEEISIETLQFLVQYGSFYSFLTLKKRPVIEPEHLQCFFMANVAMQAMNFSFKKKTVNKGLPLISYVEGILIETVFDGDRVGITNPTTHAWNSVGVEKRAAADSSLYLSGRWCHYWGIPFTPEEYRKISRLADPHKKTFGPIFRTKRFNPAVKNYILSILRKRTYIRRRLVGKKEFPKQRFVRKIRLVT